MTSLPLPDEKEKRDKCVKKDSKLAKQSPGARNKSTTVDVPIH